MYFIFAVCQWLPTNHRVYRKLPGCEEKVMCLLCLGRKEETVDHLLSCPALKVETDQLKCTMQKILQDANFPFASLILPAWSKNVVNKWVFGAQHLISTTLPPSKLERMAWDFYHANKNKQFIGIRHFLDRTSTAIQEQKQGVVVVRESLVALLVTCFNLGIEGNSTVLQRCDAFLEWCSESSNDIWFGAKSAPLQLSLGGFNSYFNLLGSSDSGSNDAAFRFQGANSCPLHWTPEFHQASRTR